MFPKIIITTLSLLFCWNAAVAQRTWSLDKCIQHVKRNNTTRMRKATNAVDQAKVRERIWKANQKPDLAARTNLGLNLGRTVDPSTNVFDNQAIGYNSLSLETNYTLYDGNRTQHALSKSRLEVQALEADAEQLAKDLSLQVLQAYLQILMAEEQLANARKNREQTRDWYDQMSRLVRGQIRSPSDLQSVEVQLSRDEQRVIDRKNFVDRSYVQLKQILELDPSLSLKIEKPSEIPGPDDNARNISFKKIFSKALNTQPGIKGGELWIQSLEFEEKMAQAGKLPTVSLFGGLWSNYSSATKDFSRPDFSDASNVKNEWEVFLQTADYYETLEWETIEGITYPQMPYFRQLRNNLGYGLGMQVQIPIIDNKKTQLQSQLARLNIQQMQEDNIQVKQQLRANIQNAIDDVTAAVDKLEAAEKTLQLLESSIQSMKRKLSAGNINPFEYKTILNERDQAEIELVLAKYEFLLKKMIVDFYEGKPLKI